MTHTLHLVYDAECLFCIRALRALQRLDRRKALRLWDGTDPAAVAQRFPSLEGADLTTAMFAVSEQGEVFRGFFAFRRALWVSPWTWLLLPLFYVPGATLAGPVVYAWIARHRRSLGCGGGQCELPGRR
jgi:predicted DCC family thiol-disulfide oxidoreductase YuxK